MQAKIYRRPIMSGYWRNGEPNWRRMEAMARRGWGRFAAGVECVEGWCNMGGNFRIGRMLASCDLRLVALYLIEQQPRPGYDLIKATEGKSAGFYTPSPGMVYPALTFLEEAGYVTSEADGNKKLYTITEEGRTHLADNRDSIEATLAFLAKAGPADRDLKDVVPELNDARRALKDAIKSARRASEDQQRHAAEILKRAAAEIEALGDDDVDI